MRQSFVRRFVAIGAALAITGAAALRSERALADRRPKVVPVVVFARDLPSGSVVTVEDLAQRAVPENAVTSSVVKPESASYVVNQKVLVPVLAGDLLFWSMFETTRGDATEQCVHALARSGTAEEQLKAHRARVLQGTAEK